MRLFLRPGHRPLDLLDPPLAQGGEGWVHAIGGDPAHVAKRYKTPTRERERKLETMLRMPLPGSGAAGIGLAWPRALLEDARGVFSGFLMDRVAGKEFEVLANPKLRRHHLPALAPDIPLRTALNLCRALDLVHRAGLIVGDLNDGNLLVDGVGGVALIDMDSYQVGRFRCQAVVYDYVAPELQGLAPADADRTPEGDRFALAVLLHKLLLGGVHPFSGAGEPHELAQRISRQMCLYAPGGPAPPVGTPPLGGLPRGLRTLFLRALVDGHGAPASRPSAQAWAVELDGASHGPTPRVHSSHPYRAPRPASRVPLWRWAVALAGVLPVLFFATAHQGPREVLGPAPPMTQGPRPYEPVRLPIPAPPPHGVSKLPEGWSARAIYERAFPGEAEPRPWGR